MFESSAGEDHAAARSARRLSSQIQPATAAGTISSATSSTGCAKLTRASPFSV
jgi:hypothetical protein